jgi:hypothetical protein
MAKSTVIPDVTTRAAAAATAPKGAPQSLQAGRAVLWAAILLVGAATLLPITAFASRELKTWSLVNADDATIRSELASVRAERASADWLETLAELGLEIEPQDAERAMRAAASATDKDPSRARAWALQAYLEYRRAKQVNPAVLEALSKSMAACPFCSEELVRWRFNFVLANWTAIPDDIRRNAFEQADILRWMGDNGEFLAEMRIKATQAGIPYDERRSAVNTPARTWDLAPLETRAAPTPAGNNG